MPQHQAVPSKPKRISGRRLQRIRKRIFTRDKGLCQACLRNQLVTLACEVDHILPLYKSGAEDDDNRQSLCKECHLLKSLKERGSYLGSDSSGMPRDPEHPWNQ